MVSTAAKRSPGRRPLGLLTRRHWKPEGAEDEVGASGIIDETGPEYAMADDETAPKHVAKLTTNIDGLMRRKENLGWVSFCCG